MRFSTEDIKFFTEQRISPEEVEVQYAQLKNGLKPVRLDRSASVGDGILALNAYEKNELARYFERNAGKYSITKFVPASGAATRMFSDLMDFYRNGRENSFTQKFFANIRKFIFFQDLEKYVNYGNDKRVFTKFLLTDSGLNYGSLPKGLLKFYKDGDSAVTPVEMHMIEAADYAYDLDKKVSIHFTIPEAYEAQFKKLTWKTECFLEDKRGVLSKVTFSFQKPETNTIAVDEMGKLARDTENKIVLRPGGHGALLHNLEDLSADLIFIRNIDNVLPPAHNTLNVFYEKILAGYLLKIRERLFTILDRLASNDEGVYEEAIVFAESQLNVVVPVLFKTAYTPTGLYDLLNRPIRVCGMIKNTGEPGGGPFWIKDKKGALSLQIIEKAQLDPKDDEQQHIFKHAAYFNPVDMVLSTVNHKGNKFALTSYCDKNQALITERSINNKKIAALEHPGLWNGSMAGWHSIFIEMPGKAFNPVKNVLDLLRLNGK